MVGYSQRFSDAVTPSFCDHGDLAYSQFVPVAPRRPRLVCTRIPAGRAAFDGPLSALFRALRVFRLPACDGTPLSAPCEPAQALTGLGWSARECQEFGGAGGLGQSFRLVLR